MPWFMNPWLIVAFIAAVGTSSVGGFFFGRSHEAALCKQAKDSEDKKRAQQLASDITTLRAKESAAQDRADQLQKENADARKTIAARDAAIRNSLRNRPERDYSAKVPEATCASSGVSGAELARGDGEFLSGFASDAAKLNQAVKYCEAQYEELYKLYSGETSEDSDQRDQQERGAVR